LTNPLPADVDFDLELAALLADEELQARVAAVLELSDQELKRAVAERDGFKCVRCGTAILGAPHSIHHLVLGNRADNRAENLITLCGSGTTGCHGWAHDFPRLAREGGWVRSKHSTTAALEPVWYEQPGRTGWHVLLPDLGLHATMLRIPGPKVRVTSDG
jgi:hypothetical protein